MKNKTYYLCVTDSGIFKYPEQGNQSIQIKYQLVIFSKKPFKDKEKVERDDCYFFNCKRNPLITKTHYSHSGEILSFLEELNRQMIEFVNNRISYPISFQDKIFEVGEIIKFDDLPNVIARRIA